MVALATVFSQFYGADGGDGAGDALVSGRCATPKEFRCVDNTSVALLQSVPLLSERLTGMEPDEISAVLDVLVKHRLLRPVVVGSRMYWRLQR